MVRVCCWMTLCSCCLRAAALCVAAVPLQLAVDMRLWLLLVQASACCCAVCCVRAAADAQLLFQG